MYSSIKIAFVVDKSPIFYYKAEVLIFSILTNTQFSKSQLVVHCIEGVATSFIDYLQKNQIEYVFIKPFLDKRYCNKIIQLASFVGKGFNVILLDTDTYFIDKIEIEDFDVFQAKVVDYPNPPLKSIKNIYREANVPSPEIVSSDCGRFYWYDKTPITNFNGGFYYIPSSMIENVYLHWSTWATWLHEGQEKYLNKKYSNHIDQISMSLALATSQAHYSIISANYNYPIHINKKCRYYNNAKPLIMLHYHHMMNSFGYLDKCSTNNASVNNAINKANNQIINQDFVFLLEFRNEMLSSQNYGTIDQRELNTNVDTIKNVPNIIFHVGSSKTGSTSIQFFLYENENLLNKNQIKYAQNVSLWTNEPKHQWLVESLLNEKFDNFIEELENEINICFEKTLLFSAEGICNHWFDFSPKSKYFLKQVAGKYRIRLVIVFREPREFILSYYQQSLKNPVGLKKYAYSLPKDINQILELSQFKRHLDYYSIVKQMREVFGKDNVDVLIYEKRIVKQFISYLGISEPISEIELYKNKKLSNRDIKSLIWINRISLTNNIKAILFKVFKSVNKRLNYKYGDIQPQNINEFYLKLIEREKKILLKEYNISFNNSSFD